MTDLRPLNPPEFYEQEPEIEEVETEREFTTKEIEKHGIDLLAFIEENYMPKETVDFWTNINSDLLIKAEVMRYGQRTGNI